MYNQIKPGKTRLFLDIYIMAKKLFFGWSNIKWFITEMGNMYSGKTSYFSKKRVESGIAFVIGQWGMVYFMVQNHAALTASDVVLWAGVEFAVAGYIVNQIQREKSTTPKEFLEEKE
jgi:hypothetical protein